jgi:hypothetical protein
MPTWDEAANAYKEDLISHYEIGNSIGFIEGSIQAYLDVLESMETAKDFDELAEHVNREKENYEKMMEETTNE